MTDIAMSMSFMIDGMNRTILLENIEDVPVNTSSTITNHPVPSGDYISDSMFREPITMEVTGTFSNDGLKGLVSDIESEMTLEAIEKYFEDIKNKGILSDLVKVKVIDNQSPRFLIRKGMALKSIRWTERINSLGFTFSFQQVMQVEVNEYDVDPTDENLPDVEDPKTLNFTESLFDKDKMSQLLMKGLIDNKLITKQFLNYLGSLSTSSLIAFGIGLAAVLIFTSASIAVAAIVGAVAAVGYLIYKLIDQVKKSSQKIRTFELHKSDNKNEEETTRLAKLQEDIFKQMEILNDSIAVYQVSSNKAHQAILSIDDEYYCFTFTRNNLDNSYGLTILDLDGKIMKNTEPIPNVKNKALKSLDDCTSQTAIISTNTGYQVFLLNTSENRTDDLTECYIMISSIDMDKFTELVSKIIVNYLIY